MPTKKQPRPDLSESVRQERQEEVYRLHCRGLSQRAIGAELGLDVSQVSRALAQVRAALLKQKGEAHLANLADRLTEGAWEDLADSWDTSLAAGVPRQRRRVSVGVPKALRYRVMQRDGFVCRYCGRGAPDVELEVDHIEPVSAGGTDTPENLATACLDCNRGKGGIEGDPDEMVDLPPDYRVLAVERSNRAKLRDQIAKLNGLDHLKQRELAIKERQAEAQAAASAKSGDLLQQLADGLLCGPPEGPEPST